MISKKELLSLTGISYGQLYRWKREKLIPEEWFIKKSSYTGQETYFPREKILSRVQFIQEMKDEYSLEEISRMLYPVKGTETFSYEEIRENDEISENVKSLFQMMYDDRNPDYVALLYMTVISEWEQKYHMEKGVLERFVDGMKIHIQMTDSITNSFALIQDENEYYGVIMKEPGDVYFDKRIKVLEIVSLSEVSNQINLKNKKK